VCVCVCVCVCLSVWVGARVLECAWARVELLIEHVTRRHIVICGLSGSTLFFGIISQTARFSEKGHVRKIPNMKFYWNPSSESRVVRCGDRDRRTDMTKLIVAFRNFTNAPKTEIHCCSLVGSSVRQVFQFRLWVVIRIFSFSRNPYGHRSQGRIII
jgi:hypothetical protein